jgi:hypothetical protein
MPTYVEFNEVESLLFDPHQSMTVILNCWSTGQPGHARASEGFELMWFCVELEKEGERWLPGGINSEKRVHYLANF